MAGRPVDRDVTFTGGPDTIFVSLMMPANASGAVPAVVIISGGGPTERNGNDPQYQHMDTNLNFARTLAGVGVASFFNALDADHTFRVISGEPHPVADDANPNLTFSPEVEGALGHFLNKHGLLPRTWTSRMAA